LKIPNTSEPKQSMQILKIISSLDSCHFVLVGLTRVFKPSLLIVGVAQMDLSLASLNVAVNAAKMLRRMPIGKRDST